MSQRFKRTERLCALLTTTALALFAACGDDGADGPTAPDVAMTANGPVMAVDANGMRHYFAIPFAAPPVGDLRWKAPAAPQNWTTPLANTTSATACIQTSASPFRISPDSEDCLYLDVHAPPKDVHG